MIHFVIDGEPVGKSSIRVSKHGRHYSPKTEVYMRRVAKAIEQQNIGENLFSPDVPLMVTIEAFFPIPKGTSKKMRAKMLESDIRPTKKPDADNISKIICDCITKAKIWGDDKQITNLLVIKKYAEEPRVSIWIQEDDE